MLSSSVTVRRYEPADAEMVEEIEKASTKELTPMSELARYYEIMPDCFLVAEVDKRVVGYVLANTTIASDGVREGHILAIAVSPACRRNGVGRELLTRILDILKTEGASRTRLEVKTSNSSAREFYLREGFEVIAIRRGYYRMRGYTEDALLMLKGH